MPDVVAERILNTGANMRDENVKKILLRTMRGPLYRVGKIQKRTDVAYAWRTFDVVQLLRRQEGMRLGLRSMLAGHILRASVGCADKKPMRSIMSSL